MRSFTRMQDANNDAPAEDYLCWAFDVILLSISQESH